MNIKTNRKTSIKQKLLLSAMLSLTLSACATKPYEADLTGLSMADQRLNDIVLHADNAVFEATEKRLFELIDQGRSADSYFMAKARAWLDFAVDEHRENEIDGTDNLALEQAQIIITELENNRVPSRVTPLINGVPRLREDLWSHGETLKQSGGVICAEQYVARLEVQLVWSGHEFGEMGWRHAEPYIRIAEQLNSEINAQMATCDAAALQAKAEPKPDLTSGRAPVRVPSVSQDMMRMANRVHFEFDRYDLLPDAETILRFVVIILKQNPDTVVELLGYSDERGSLNYNQSLSQKRANAVRVWLRDAGIAPERLRAIGQGEAYVNTTVNKQHKYDRRVEIHFISTRLTEQL